MNNLFTCVFVFLFLNAYSKDRLVTFEWKFIGIEAGYDHLNRNKIIVDGTEIKLTDSCFQSEWGIYRLPLSKTHQIKVINEAYYAGKWVEHTFENEFSINAVCEFDLNAKEVSKVRIEFDLDKPGVLITRFDLKGVELKETSFRGKHYPLEVNWRFVNIEDGYDHRSRMVVFVDDVQYGVSSESSESAGGIFNLKIPKGLHRIRIVNQSYLNDTWQDHTIVNNYSVEAVYEKEIAVNKGVRVTLVIDLNDEVTVNEWEF